MVCDKALKRSAIIPAFLLPQEKREGEYVNLELAEIEREKGNKAFKEQRFPEVGCKQPYLTIIQPHVMCIACCLGLVPVWSLCTVSLSAGISDVGTMNEVW